MGDQGQGRGRGKGKGKGKRGGREDTRSVWGASKNEGRVGLPSAGFWDVKSDTSGGASQQQDESVRTQPLPRQESKNISGERKFAEACQKIQESVERYLERHDLTQDPEEDQDEDDLEEGTIIDRVYHNYGGHGEKDRTQQCLLEAVKSGTLVCLICIDSIKRLDPIWNCGECYSSFHVQCVQKWAKDSIFQLSEAQADTPGQRVPPSAFQWCCPKCRCEYSERAIPTRYLCFCGKKIDPEFDPWLPPHSCGERCGRKLKPSCGHSCLLLCHPGPCPPCPKNVNNSCHCGQHPPKTRRCSAKSWSCGQHCGRTLSCGQHQCQNNCHPGECPPCPRKSLQACSCGNSTQQRECAQPVWHCDKVCNKLHSCGYHRCQRVCHQGECGQCPDSGQRTCPCGKTSQSLPCTQEVQNCGDTCGKQLACGVHLCAERCHKGACPTCLQFRVKQCRCGAKAKEMACSKEFTCELKCKKLRDCGHHTCSKKCCAGECPRCEQVCGRTLGCHTHRCISRCHQGPCYPCTITHTLSCTCGKTSISVPCGRQKTTRPPKCSQLCMKPPDCHHPERKKHKCHEGPCPTCRFVCGLELPCHHLCPQPCHDAVPVKVVDKKKRAGPWEPIVAPHVEIQKQPCPPCQIPVPTTCLGNHETPDWPCSDVRPYSCGRKCGCELACTNHTCQRECHIVESAPVPGKAGTTCFPCEAPCSKIRPESCSHECGKPCHPGPCAPCQLMLKVRCHCSLTLLYVQCYAWTTSASKEKEMMQSCKNQCNKLIACGHRCSKECHSGSCSQPQECHKRVTVRCPCKRLRKEFRCPLVTAGEVKLECDAVCAAKIEEKRKAQEEEERIKQEMEQARQKKEVEEFERKLEGRKHRRRNRHQTEMEVKTGLWQRHGQLLMGTATLMAFVACTVYLLIPQH